MTSKEKFSSHLVFCLCCDILTIVRFNEIPYSSSDERNWFSMSGNIVVGFGNLTIKGVPGEDLKKS